MFFAEEDLTLHITRGDTGELVVRANDYTSDGGETPYIFKAGDILRLKVYEKKNCENVILQKDFGVETETEFVTLELTETDTRIGETISKPVDYWYEIELNPYTEPQTIVGYDDDGAKIFKLYPEGKDTEVIPPTPEEIGVIDSELSLTSQRAIQNQAVARAFAALSEDNTATQIKEQNGKRELTFWVGTQDEFNALETQVENCFYIISKSTNLSNLKATVNEIIHNVNLLNNSVDNLYTDVDTFKNDVENSNKAQIEMIENKFNENKTIVEEYHGDRTHYFKFSNGLEIEFGNFFIFDGGQEIHSDCDIVLSDLGSLTYSRKKVRFPFYKAKNIESLNVSLYDYNTSTDDKLFQAINVEEWEGKEGRFLIELSGGDRNSVTFFNSANVGITYSAFGFDYGN